MTIIPVNPIPSDNRLYTNITPFTVRDNATYLIVLEEMRQYINNTLVPFINTNVANLDKAWTEQVNALIESWNEQSEALIQQVQEIAAGLGSSVEDAQAAADAAQAAAELAEQFASTVQEIQDSAITQIFNNLNSDFRQSINAVLNTFIREDETDPGTFIIELPDAPPPPEPGQITPDPNDPGFFV